MKGWKIGNGRKYLIREYGPKKKPKKVKKPIRKGG